MVPQAVYRVGKKTIGTPLKSPGQRSYTKCLLEQIWWNTSSNRSHSPCPGVGRSPAMCLSGICDISWSGTPSEQTAWGFMFLILTIPSSVLLHGSFCSKLCI
ncbi:hypothetical protein R3I93_000265 [Phoxinus phoxinus]|uniref:Uncharacterized protein n=1 Tax=Phoxinus phoxinus TaxID=58324 RepID=A0AAN9DP28_9TELE